MKKKILCFILAMFLIMPGMIMLTGCGKSSDDTTAKVMNVELNPEIEFILDKDDKVVSVNALDEDGNQIISLSIETIGTTSVSKFEGMPADEAVELFLEIAKENGYLITGEEENITIEVSGKAEDLMKKVKNKANKFFDDNGLDIGIVTEKIEKEDIVAEVQKCMQEYSEAELKNMTQEQLIKLLKGSRKETKDLLTQELKDAYYNMRAEKINIAELEKLLEFVNMLGETENTDVAEFKQRMNDLTTALTALEQAYQTYYLTETSDYNIKKQAYIDAKEALLDARLELVADGISEDEKNTLDELQRIADEAETALEQAKVTAEQEIQTARDAVTNAINSANEKIAAVKGALESSKEIFEALGIKLNELDNAKQELKNNFKEDYFKGHEIFGEHVGHNKGHWGQEQPAA